MNMDQMKACTAGRAARCGNRPETAPGPASVSQPDLAGVKHDFHSDRNHELPLDPPHAAVGHQPQRRPVLVNARRDTDQLR